jgi:predicted HTH domain antitoxin
MSLVIPDELLQTAQISATDLKLEIAILLFQQQQLTLSTASQFADMNQLEFQRILDSRTIPIYASVEDFRQNLRTLKTNGSELDPVHLTQAEILQQIEQRRTFSPAPHHLPDTLTLLQDDRAR